MLNFIKHQIYITKQKRNLPRMCKLDTFGKESTINRGSHNKTSTSRFIPLGVVYKEFPSMSYQRYFNKKCQSQNHQKFINKKASYKNGSAADMKDCR